MNGQDIVKDLRERLDDEKQPYLWSSTFLLKAANEAVNEICRRTLCITDDTTAADSSTRGICRQELSAGTSGYSLSPLVLQVLRVKLPSGTAAVAAGTAGYTVPLTQYTRDELDAEVDNWEELTGTPWGWISETSNELKVVPKPEVKTTASLVVHRLPLADFTLETSPEIVLPPGWWHWAMHLAYLKNDSDTQNIQLAEYHEKKFDAAFGPQISVKDQQMRRQIKRGGEMRFRRFGS